MGQEPFYIELYRKLVETWWENKHQFPRAAVTKIMGRECGPQLSKLTSVGLLDRCRGKTSGSIYRVVEKVSDAEVKRRITHHELNLRQTRDARLNRQVPLDLKPAARKPRDGIFVRVKGHEMSVLEARRLYAELHKLFGDQEAAT